MARFRHRRRLTATDRAKCRKSAKKKGRLQASGPSLGRKRPRRAAVRDANHVPHCNNVHRTAQNARGHERQNSLISSRSGCRTAHRANAASPDRPRTRSQNASGLRGEHQRDRRRADRPRPARETDRSARRSTSCTTNTPPMVPMLNSVIPRPTQMRRQERAAVREQHRQVGRRGTRTPRARRASQSGSGLPIAASRRRAPRRSRARRPAPAACRRRSMRSAWPQTTTPMMWLIAGSISRSPRAVRP